MFGAALPHHYYWFIPCHISKLTFQYFSGDFREHEVRICWVCNLVLEIYNVLYGEAIPPKILFFF